MLKKLFILAAICFLPIVKVYCQGEIPVNMYTGMPNISVDLYTIKDHDLAEPIRVAYNVNDVNLNGSHTYGVGWDLTSGNQQVSREVRGLPDDFKNSSDGRLGWLYSNNYSSITSFPNSSDLLASTTADEQSDYTFFANANYVKDTEPDIFNFSVGEYSGKFVFGNDGTIKLIPYQDLQIVPTYANSPTDLTITGWTITTNSGVIYSLNEIVPITRTLSKSTNALVDGIDQTTLKVFEREYQFYKTATTYNSSWLLTLTASPTGASLTYAYYPPSTQTITEQKDARIFDALWFANNRPLYKSNFSLMKETVVINRKDIASVTSSVGTSAIFTGNTKIQIKDLSRSATPFKEFNFTYAYGFLIAISEYDPVTCIRLPPYQMFYNESESYPGGGPTQDFWEVNPYHIFFHEPESSRGSSSSQDFWGFYNGAQNYTTTNGVNQSTSVPTIYVYPDENAYDRYRLYPIPNYAGNQVVLTGDANRLPNAGTITIGTLQRLVYPEGGEAYFGFEANTFYDAKAGQDQYGGGLRISSVTYFDGVNPNANISKIFTYKDTQGKSSGQLVSRPSFAIPVWQMITPTWADVPTQTTHLGYTLQFSAMPTLADKWRKTTIVTGFDLATSESTSGSPVGYSRVEVLRQGAGKAVFEYTIPAKYGDPSTGGTSTDWTPSVTKFARPGTYPSMNNIAAGEAGLYTLFPNPFYDYERGLLTRKSEYNEAGALVRIADNTYQYIFKTGTQPSTTVGVAYDRLANSNANDNIFLYSRYQLLGDVTKVLASETVKTYDAANPLKFVTESTAYTYGSAYHKLLSKVAKTIPGGSIYTTSFKYTLDYPVTTTVPSDSSLWMIKMLKDSRRYTTLIEQVNSQQLSGGVERVTGATLSKFRPFSFNKPLLREVLVFRPATPVTNFASSGVTNYAFTNDSRYESVQKINEYTTFDIPLNSTGENRMTGSSLWGYNKRVPVAQVANVRNISVGFSDFETNNEAEFAPTSAYYGPGRTGLQSIHPYAALERTIVKPGTATKYLLTFWLKNTANTAVTLRITRKDASGNTISFTDITPTPTTAEFQLFTYPIDVSTLPSTFKLNIQGQGLSQPSGSGPSLLPLLDDVAFYPDYASITSATYDMPFGVSSSTDEAGRTGYTVFDNMGRVKMIKDQEKKIRQVNTYSFPGQILPGLIASVVDVIGGPVMGKNIQFTADPNNCIPGALFAWRFEVTGNYSAPSSSNISPQMYYADTLQHFVEVRVSHPDLPSSVDGSYQFKPIPRPFDICASGVQTMTSGSVVSSYTCFTNTMGDNWVSFKAQPTETISAYQWQKRNAGTTIWTNTGTNAIQLPFQKVDLVTPSFEVRCIGTLPGGGFMISNIMTVTVN
jgi:hypothetical protein